MKRVTIKLNKKYTSTELIYTLPDSKTDQEIEEEFYKYFERVNLYLDIASWKIINIERININEI